MSDNKEYTTTNDNIDNETVKEFEEKYNINVNIEMRRMISSLSIMILIR